MELYLSSSEIIDFTLILTISSVTLKYSATSEYVTTQLLRALTKSLSLIRKLAAHDLAEFSFLSLLIFSR